MRQMDEDPKAKSGAEGGRTEEHAVTRRGFIRKSAYGTLGASLGVAAWRAGRADAQEGGRSRVVIARDPKAISDGKTDEAAVGRMLASGMEALTGKSQAEAWAPHFSPDDRVMLKTNVMMNRTHSEVLYAIYDALTEHVGIPGDAIGAFDRSSGGIGRDELEPMPRRYRLGDESVSEAVHWSTALINIPGLKRHFLSGVAIAVKNWCGAVMPAINVQDDDRAAFKIHGDSCAEVGVINALAPIRDRSRLIVVDALTPFYGRGPQVDPRYFWDYCGLIVSTDPVAADVVGTALLQEKIDETEGRPTPISPPPKHIEVAGKKYGLGQSDPRLIDVVEV